MLQTAEDKIVNTTSRIHGTVKRTFPKRGFFWLAGDDGEDYFGHQSNIQNGVPITSTWVGQRCQFTPNQGTDKGPFATDIVMEHEARHA